MNWTQLFEMQSQLDEYITGNHQLENENLFNKKILALLVELGELANETRCFKFWSRKKSSDESIVLEEYVDNIHFLLSLGIERKYQFSKIEIPETKNEVTEQFNEVFCHVSKFYQEQTEANYLHMIETYLQLANLLGFTEQAIFNAYLEKNEVNYERQKTGY